MVQNMKHVVAMEPTPMMSPVCSGWREGAKRREEEGRGRWEWRERWEERSVREGRTREEGIWK